MSSATRLSAWRRTKIIELPWPSSGTTNNTRGLERCDSIREAGQDAILPARGDPVDTATCCFHAPERVTNLPHMAKHKDRFVLIGSNPPGPVESPETHPGGTSSPMPVRSTGGTATRACTLSAHPKNLPPASGGRLA